MRRTVCLLQSDRRTILSNYFATRDGTEKYHGLQTPKLYNPVGVSLAPQKWSPIGRLFGRTTTPKFKRKLCKIHTQKPHPPLSMPIDILLRLTYI